MTLTALRRLRFTATFVVGAFASITAYAIDMSSTSGGTLFPLPPAFIVPSCQLPSSSSSLMLMPPLQRVVRNAPNNIWRDATNNGGGVRWGTSRRWRRSNDQQRRAARPYRTTTTDLHVGMAGFPVTTMDGTMEEEEDDNVSGIVVEEERMLRFGGTGRLFAKEEQTPISNSDSTSPSPPPSPADIVLERLTTATVAVVGLGGVGSWAAEALCRSGVGNLILIDLDDICISNTNRQLHASSSTVGRMKIDEMRRRLVDINPRCNVTLVHDFITTDNAHEAIERLLPSLSVCIDAIDGMHEKTALMLACVDQSVPIVTCGGAAGRSDPTKITAGDLTEVKEDRLLFQCRKLMRQKFGFPKVPEKKNKKKHRIRKWRITAVYSEELQKKVNAQDNDAVSSFRRCDGALGTACFVTGTYGFVAAGKAIEMIATDEWVVPKKRWGGGEGSATTPSSVGDVDEASPQTVITCGDTSNNGDTGSKSLRLSPEDCDPR